MNPEIQKKFNELQPLFSHPDYRVREDARAQWLEFHRRLNPEPKPEPNKEGLAMIEELKSNPSCLEKLRSWDGREREVAVNSWTAAHRLAYGQEPPKIDEDRRLRLDALLAYNRNGLRDAYLDKSHPGHELAMQFVEEERYGIFGDGKEPHQKGASVIGSTKDWIK